MYQLLETLNTRGRFSIRLKGQTEGTEGTDSDGRQQRTSICGGSGSGGVIGRLRGCDRIAFHFPRWQHLAFPPRVIGGYVTTEHGSKKRNSCW